MNTTLDTRSKRQMAYVRRAKKARFFGRLLIPVTLMTISAAAWSEPSIAAQIEAGLVEFKPIAEDLIAMLTGAEPPARAAEEVADAGLILPTSLLPVNRP